MNILLLSRWFPYPPNNGSKIRIYNLLRVLSKFHQVTLLSFDDQLNTSQNDIKIRSLCKDIISVPRNSYQPNSLRALLGFLTTTPRFIFDTFSAEMANEIQKILSNRAFDLIIASQIRMACYHNYFEGHQAIFDEIEIGVQLERYTKTKSVFSSIRHGITWHKFRNYLTKLVKSFSTCTVASKVELNFLLKNGIRKDNIFVLPNCIEWSEYQNLGEINENNSIIFTGSFSHHPNYEAMIWFLEKVFPLILHENPKLQLFVTGDHLNLPLPNIKNVITTGFVDDVRPLIAKATVSINPLLSGGGTRLKILEAMAIGTPVVSTSKGAEGLEIIPGEHFLLSDTPQEFAEQVLSLFNNKELSNHLSHNAKRVVKEKYDWETVVPLMQQILKSAIENKPNYQKKRWKYLKI